MELDPEFKLAFYYRGRVHRSLDRFPEAVADFTRTVELDSQFALAYYYRGASYSSQGRNASAIADFKKVMEVSTDDTVLELADRQLQSLG